MVTTQLSVHPSATASGERYLCLRLFTQYANLRLSDYPCLNELIRCLNTLRYYLAEEWEPAIDQVRSQLKDAQASYQMLQAMGLWGVTEEQRTGFALVEAEVYEAFPALAPKKSGESN